MPGKEEQHKNIMEKINTKFIPKLGGILELAQAGKGTHVIALNDLFWDFRGDKKPSASKAQKKPS